MGKSTILTKCSKYTRKACGDSLDSWKGENYQIFCEDCIPRLNRYKQENKKFDFIINDLTALIQLIYYINNYILNIL